MDDVDDFPKDLRAFRRESAMRTAEGLGLLGPKDREIGGLFPDALIEAAKRAIGITDITDLRTYALIKVALEDDFVERLIELRGSVPKGTFFAG